MIPESLRPIAKALVAFVVPTAGLLVAVGVLDVEAAEKITGQVVALSIALGLGSSASVYATRNTR